MKISFDFLTSNMLLPENICAACEQGRLQPRVNSYTVKLANNRYFTIADVLQEVCNYCEEIFLAADAADTVDAAIAAQTQHNATGEIRGY